MSDLISDRNNHLAYGAVDDHGQVYIVLDPIDPTVGLARRAMPLGAGKTLIHAETLAADFNAGRTWSFQTSPGQTLVGDQIPRLHRGPD